MKLNLYKNLNSDDCNGISQGEHLVSKFTGWDFFKIGTVLSNPNSSKLSTNYDFFILF